MIIVANWKMNGNKDSVREWFSSLSTSKGHIVFCPPFPLIDMASQIAPEHVHVGAQDCHYEGHGAFTGFTSPVLLKEMGCRYVILGHSERRFMESNEEVQKKAASAQKVGLIPIICVGESREMREKGQHLSFVKEQVRVCTKGLEDGFLLAYEPLWAIGTGEVCHVKDIAEMHGMMKTLSKANVLYGGSVKPDNAKDILSLVDVDGLLVGGASLDVMSFNQIIS